MTRLYNDRLKVEIASEAKLKAFDDAVRATQEHCNHEWEHHRDPAGGSDSYEACLVCGKWR
jgi:hypothetical protein